MDGPDAALGEWDGGTVLRLHRCDSQHRRSDSVQAEVSFPGESRLSSSEEGEDKISTTR